MLYKLKEKNAWFSQFLCQKQSEKCEMSLYLNGVRLIFVEPSFAAGTSARLELQLKKCLLALDWHFCTLQKSD